MEDTIHGTPLDLSDRKYPNIITSIPLAPTQSTANTTFPPNYETTGALKHEQNSHSATQTSDFVASRRSTISGSILPIGMLLNKQIKQSEQSQNDSIDQKNLTDTRIKYIHKSAPKLPPIGPAIGSSEMTERQATFPIGRNEYDTHPEYRRQSPFEAHGIPINLQSPRYTTQIHMQLPHCHQQIMGSEPVMATQSRFMAPQLNHMFAQTPAAYMQYPNHVNDHSSAYSINAQWVPTGLKNRVSRRFRRRYNQIERRFGCLFSNCTKSYGLLNHLNTHIVTKKHGKRRAKCEFQPFVTSSTIPRSLQPVIGLTQYVAHASKLASRNENLEFHCGSEASNDITGFTQKTDDDKSKLASRYSFDYDCANENCYGAQSRLGQWTETISTLNTPQEYHHQDSRSYGIVLGNLNDSGSAVYGRQRQLSLGNYFQPE